MYSRPSLNKIGAMPKNKLRSEVCVEQVQRGTLYNTQYTLYNV